MVDVHLDGSEEAVPAIVDLGSQATVLNWEVRVWGFIYIAGHSSIVVQPVRPAGAKLYVVFNSAVQS